MLQRIFYWWVALFWVDIPRIYSDFRENTPYSCAIIPKKCNFAKTDNDGRYRVTRERGDT